MNSYLILFFAIVFEVTGTMMLPVTNSFSRIVPSILVIFFYTISFYFLSITVEKLPLAIVYASWAGLGVFTVSLLSYIIYKQTLNWQTVLGLFFIVIGVVLVNIYKTGD